jgi:hypothetical protein
VAPRASRTSGDFSGIRIFDPQQVFRRDFPFSWCDGVFKLESSTYAPIRASDTGAVLVLQGKPETPYVVCALPLQPTWLPSNISRFTALRFAIRVRETPPDVLLSLVSQSPGGLEIESGARSLRSEGLEYGPWMELSVPLAGFEGSVDLSCVRLIKFVGYASFRLELARIYIQ